MTHIWKRNYTDEVWHLFPIVAEGRLESLCGKIQQHHVLVRNTPPDKKDCCKLCNLAQGLQEI